MRLILQREVENLGAPGDIVDVADGYARNYLVPRGLAIPASKGAVKHAERLRTAHTERVEKARAEAEAVAATLSRASVRIPAKAGEEGRLFGSITPERLAQEISRATGTAVDRRRIHLDEPIRSVGMHEVRIGVHADVTARVPVEVVPE